MTRLQNSALRLEPVSGIGVQPSAPETSLRAALQTALNTVEHLESQGAEPLLWQAWLRVGRCYRELHAPREAQATLRQALRAARVSRSHDGVVAVLCELAETTCDLAESGTEPGRAAQRIARDKARDEVFEASTVLLRAEPSAAAAQLLLRLSDVLNRCGDHDDAGVLQGRALTWMAGSTEH